MGTGDDDREIKISALIGFRNHRHETLRITSGLQTRIMTMSNSPLWPHQFCYDLCLTFPIAREIFRHFIIRLRLAFSFY